MNNKVFNVDLLELVRVLQYQLSQGHLYADFEIESTEEMDGTKLVIYPIIIDGNRSEPSKIDPRKDPDDLINDLT